MPEKVALTGTEEACLHPFMTITDLQGKKLMLESYLGAKEARTTDTLEVKSDKLQELADGWGIVPLSDPTPVRSLYAYAGNTSISEKDSFAENGGLCIGNHSPSS